VRRTPGEISFWTDARERKRINTRQVLLLLGRRFRRAVDPHPRPTRPYANAINFSCCSSWLRRRDKRVNVIFAKQLLGFATMATIHVIDVALRNDFDGIELTLDNIWTKLTTILNCTFIMTWTYYFLYLRDDTIFII